jgi:predicted transcriptional regulator
LSSFVAIDATEITVGATIPRLLGGADLQGLAQPALDRFELRMGGQAAFPPSGNRWWYRKVLPIDTESEAVMAVAAARPVAIKIDEDTKARVKRLADSRQRSPHWLMREAIMQYVDREEKREAFRQDAFQAWEAFRATGQHVTADQADAWLAQLEQGNDVDPPACRR